MRTRNRAERPARRRLAGVAAIVAALALLLLAGCGGSGGGSGTTTAGTSATGRSGGPGGFELSDETRACLKEQGVELPEPGQGAPSGSGGPPEGGPPEGGSPAGGPPGGSGKSAEKMQEAFEECGAEPPQGKPAGAPMSSAGFRKSIREYAACMRENGYALPEPDLSGEGPVFRESEVDRESPKFKKADAKCHAALGGPGEDPGAAG